MEQAIQTISLFLVLVEKNKFFDVVICGGGAAGLLLANALSNDTAFHHLRIALIEKEKKNTNDRTWCFWEEGAGKWDEIVSNTWEKAVFKADGFHSEFDLAPYKYKMIKGIDFYQKLYPQLKKNKNLYFLQEEIEDIISSPENCIVRTTSTTYSAPRVFSSIPTTAYKNQTRFPVLQQHFIGWMVKTEVPIFDPQSVTFMDFEVPQKNKTRFMYVLPFSKHEALVEYTLFSKDLLEDKEYEVAIQDYLKDKKAGDFSITETEKGSIPMTAYDFSQHNTANLMYIGTAGGWTKASTGYTFQKSVHKVDQLIAFLKKDKPLNELKQKSKFNFYDLLFLDVLAKYNEEGSLLFKQMFQNNPSKRIFAFLEEKTSLWQDVAIMRSFPVKRFVIALVKRLFQL
jgi:lycopene beta-cyclase